MNINEIEKQKVGYRFKGASFLKIKNGDCSHKIIQTFNFRFLLTQFIKNYDINFTNKQ